MKVFGYASEVCFPRDASQVIGDAGLVYPREFVNRYSL